FFLERSNDDKTNNTDSLTSIILQLSDTASLSDSEPEVPSVTYGTKVEDLSSSGSESSDEDPPEGHTGSQQPLFQLKGMSAGFSSRSHNIFDCLESSAKNAMPGLGEDNLIDKTFVRPMLPPLAPSKPSTKSASSSRVVPDYVAHPERWTKYSLEDVPETSDSKNSQVAQEYIFGLQQQRQGRWPVSVQESFTPVFNQDHSSMSDKKIVFSRPSQGGEAQLERKPVVGKKSEVGLCHLEDLDQECVPSSTGKRKRKCGSDKGDVGDGQEQPPTPGFNSSRKVNRKNFRRAAEGDED
uniref:U5 small nuclear ribonucleoprotein TSSC4 n=1 Tax=Scleropages formosus TaxID=113540 RepID=A0A8C9V2A2_SCLFO